MTSMASLRAARFTLLPVLALLHGGNAQISPAEVCSSNQVHLDFTGSCASGIANHSNLGGLGPDTGSEELRFSRIGHTNGRYVDLSIVVLDTAQTVEALSASPYAHLWTFDYTDAPYTAANAMNNGCSGLFGQVNVRLGTSVTLELQFRDHYSNALVELPAFRLSFFDVDSWNNGNKVRSQSSEPDIWVARGRAHAMVHAIAPDTNHN
jgi:hypothetical protein